MTAGARSAAAGGAGAYRKTKNPQIPQKAGAQGAQHIVVVPPSCAPNKPLFFNDLQFKGTRGTTFLYPFLSSILGGYIGYTLYYGLGKDVPLVPQIVVTVWFIEGYLWGTSFLSCAPKKVKSFNFSGLSGAHLFCSCALVILSI